MTLPYSEQCERGTWRWAMEESSLRRRAVVACPGCGVSCVLSLEHEVDAIGDVSPTLTCPESGCSFDGYITLRDWKPIT